MLGQDNIRRKCAINQKDKGWHQFSSGMEELDLIPRLDTYWPWPVLMNTIRQMTLEDNVLNVVMTLSFEQLDSSNWFSTSVQGRVHSGDALLVFAFNSTQEINAEKKKRVRFYKKCRNNLSIYFYSFLVIPTFLFWGTWRRKLHSSPWQ